MRVYEMISLTIAIYLVSVLYLACRLGNFNLAARLAIGTAVLKAIVAVGHGYLWSKVSGRNVESRKR